MASERHPSSAPSPQTTLLVLLGASEWPYDRNFPSDKAFGYAAQEIEQYFRETFGIPTENILQLFNTDSNAIEIGRKIREHLETFKRRARDVIIYYVGHAERTVKHRQLYLAVKDTRDYDREGTSLKVESLSRAVYAQARGMRRFYILDCCFAASALPHLQGVTSTELLRGAFDEVYQTQGYVALFSSSMTEASVILPDHTNTFFTKALLHVLATGNSRFPRLLSFQDVSREVNGALVALYRQYVSYPGVQSPPNAEIYPPGDLAGIPFFPNPSAGEEQTARSLRSSADIASSVRSVVVPRRGISRRAVVAGLGLFVVFASIGGGLVWRIVSQASPSLPKASFRGTTLVYNGDPGDSSDDVNAVAWSPDGSRIASGYNAGTKSTVQVWNANNGGIVFVYQGLASPYSDVANGVNTVAWSPDGRRIASGDQFNAVQVWNASNGGDVYTYSGHAKGVNAVTWLPDGKRIASGSDDTTVQVWNAIDGGNVFTYTGHASRVLTVARSPDGKRIASGGDDTTIQVWDAIDGGNIFTYRGHADTVDTVAWSPDGTRIASGSADKTVQVWNAADGGKVFIYHGHYIDVRTVAWSPGGTRIASGSADKTVQVWNARDGGDVFTYSGHNGGVWTLAWSPDGKRIASGSGDGTVQVWQVG